MDFSVRSTAIEYMDDPLLDKASYQKAYVDINRCNKLLGGNPITLKAVKKLMKTHPKESYTILDIGCGDGQMLRMLSQHINKQSVKNKLVGIDLRDDVLGLAQEASKEYDDIRFERADILKLDSSFECDIILCTLTMHHFTDQQIQKVLQHCSNLAKIGVVINDLHRSKIAYMLFKLFSIFFIRTQIAKNDGLISISKGFRRDELQNWAASLPTHQHQIRWKWAFRYLWVFSPKKPN